MADNFGLSFSPLTGNPNQKQNPTGGPSNPVQEAIRTLSYRVPTTVGARSPIPQQLLPSAGPQMASMGAGALPQASQPGTAATPQLGLEDILRKLFGLGPAPMQTQSQNGYQPIPPPPGGYDIPTPAPVPTGPTGPEYPYQPPAKPGPVITPGQDAGWQGLQNPTGFNESSMQQNAPAGGPTYGSLSKWGDEQKYSG